MASSSDDWMTHRPADWMGDLARLMSNPSWKMMPEAERQKLIDSYEQRARIDDLRFKRAHASYEVAEGGFEIEIASKSINRGMRGAIVAQPISGKSDLNANIGITGNSISHHELIVPLLFADHLEVIDFIQSDNVEWPEVVNTRAAKLVIGVEADLQEINYRAWQLRNRNDPGRWSIWHGSNINPLPPSIENTELGLRLQLQNALIVPSRDVSLDDVIMFKEARHSELLDLHHHIDDICVKVAEAGSSDAIRELEIEKFEQSVARYNKVALERNWSKSIISLSPSFSVTDAIRAALPTAGTLAMFTGSFGVGSVIAAIGTGLAAGVGVDVVRVPREQSPSFAYLYQIAHEL